MMWTARRPSAAQIATCITFNRSVQKPSYGRLYYHQVPVVTSLLYSLDVSSLSLAGGVVAWTCFFSLLKM